MRKTMMAVAALGTMAISSAADAQTYNPAYPVCLRVYGPVSYNDCSYTSLAQCQISASGRAAQCMVNPYAANAAMAPVRKTKRRPVY